MLSSRLFLLPLRIVIFLRLLDGVNSFFVRPPIIEKLNSPIHSAFESNEVIVMPKTKYDYWKTFNVNTYSSSRLEALVDKENLMAIDQPIFVDNNNTSSSTNNTQIRDPNNEYNLYLQWGPLIGGPPFLPIHVKVVYESPMFGQHKWDFVPLNATDQSTILKLIQLQSVPGEIRYFGRNIDKTNVIANFVGNENDPSECYQFQENVLERARLFCDTYSDKNLHLVSNSCLTFAAKLYFELLTAIYTQKSNG